MSKRQQRDIDRLRKEIAELERMVCLASFVISDGIYPEEVKQSAFIELRAMAQRRAYGDMQ